MKIFEYSLDESKYKKVTIRNFVSSKEDTIHHYLDYFKAYTDRLIITKGKESINIAKVKDARTCNECIFYRTNWIWYRTGDNISCYSPPRLHCSENDTYYSLDKEDKISNTNPTSIPIEIVKEVICSSDVCVYKSDDCEDSESSCLLRMILNKTKGNEFNKHS